MVTFLEACSVFGLTDNIEKKWSTMKSYQILCIQLLNNLMT